MPVNGRQVKRPKRRPQKEENSETILPAGWQVLGPLPGLTVSRGPLGAASFGPRPGEPGQRGGFVLENLEDAIEMVLTNANENVMRSDDVSYFSPRIANEVISGGQRADAGPVNPRSPFEIDDKYTDAPPNQESNLFKEKSDALALRQRAIHMDNGKMGVRIVKFRRAKRRSAWPRIGQSQIHIDPHGRVAPGF
jgi:hypothetical protein